MEEKKEPKYLDLSASCSVSVTEMLRRFFAPANDTPQVEGKEERKDDCNG